MMIGGSRRPWVHIVLLSTLVLVVVSLLSLTRLDRHMVEKLKTAITTTSSERVCEHKYDYDCDTKMQPAITTVAADYHFRPRTDYTLADKPATRIVGLLFVGRRSYVQILECYIQRNLVRNGGWLDGVIWIMRTQDQDDIDFLERTIRKTAEYSQHVVTAWDHAYEICERNTTYVKIDDDVVFIEDHTIPAIVTRLHENPAYSVVSANVMNQPALSWVHFHLGAIHPYLPELDPPSGTGGFVDDDDDDDNKNSPPELAVQRKRRTWRLSREPHWSGNESYRFDTDMDAPFPDHRWLRLPREADLMRTPAGNLKSEGKEYNGFNAAWHSWAIAAQQHYSFLENLEKGELWRYNFDLWHYWYERLSINFVTFKGDDLVEHPVPDDDDEVYLTITLPEKLSRPAVLDGTGMAVHFGFGPQTKQLNETDLLGRYMSYADEFICARPWGSPRP